MKRICKVAILILLVTFSFNIKAETATNKYPGDMSLNELLHNYNLISLGQRNNGNVEVFHIVGKFLINGSYTNGVDSYTSYSRMDFYSHEDTNFSSYIKGNIKNQIACDNRIEHTSDLYLGSSNDIDLLYPKRSDANSVNYYEISNDSGTHRVFVQDSIIKSDDYIDFKQLYDSVVEEIKDVEPGKTVDVESESFNAIGTSFVAPGFGQDPEHINTVKIKAGSNYTINNLNDLEQIVLTENQNNLDKLTVITILDEGEITMPFLGSDYYSNYGSNDYYGELVRRYGEDIKEEFYYGNTIFVVPNATKINFRERNDFKANVIAPNADLELPTMSLNGTVICNSISEMITGEIHYYPLLGNFADAKKKPSVIEEVKEEIKNVIENPETGFARYTLLIVPAVVLVFLFIAVKKNTVFNRE